MKDIKELVSGAKKGSQKAFNKLYDLTKNDIWLNCLSLLKNEENAKDVMQETYITAFLKLETLENEDKFCPWLRMTAVNKSKDFLKGKVEYQIEDEVLTNEVETNEVMLPEEYITNNSKREIILQLMSDTLTHSQYVTVFLFYFDELSISEISEVLEVSEGTVKSRLNSSRKKMKTAIEKYEEENNDKLHGVVFVPLFGSIFKEQCKHITVPEINLDFTKQGNKNITSKGAESAVKTASKGLVSSVAKTRVIAMLLGMTVICGTSISTGVLAGCVREDLPIATTASTTEVTTEPTELATEAKTSNELVSRSTGNSSGGSTGNTANSKTTASKTSTGGSGNSKSDSGNKGSGSGSTGGGNTGGNTSSAQSSAGSSAGSQKTYHEAEYKTVHHPAETKTEKVWVVDKEAYTYEKPVYENLPRTLCNICNADITGKIDGHADYHDDRGEFERFSYRCEYIDVQVGTETVEVPEEGHYETKTTVVKEAWDEQVLVSEGYWEYK